MSTRKNSDFGKIVVKAIKRLQETQGSSQKEISNYLSQEYDVPSDEIKKHISMALKQGVSYGVLLRKRNGVYSYNPKYSNLVESVSDSAGRAKTSCHGMKMARSKSRMRQSRRRKSSRRGKSSRRRKRRGGRRRRKH